MLLYYLFWMLMGFILHFYIIFGTNILIQCPVPVPVCCIFFVTQKIHIKRSPNGIKTDGDFFWNICDFWEEESTRGDARGGHQAGGVQQGSGAPRYLLHCLKVGWGPSSRARKIIYGKKSCENFSAIGVTDLREFKKP